MESFFVLEKWKRVAGHTKYADIEKDVKTIDVPFLRNILQIPLFGSKQWKKITKNLRQRADNHILRLKTPIASTEALVLVWT